MTSKYEIERDYKIDAIKGILIILVVIAPSRDGDTLHDFIFLFHMLLFFVISGYFCKEKVKLNGAYIIVVTTREK